ncbi:MAG TPA: hypothetical protein PLD59_11210 [Tepidisphaeraceae bacterium]|nr:hypothetical protein [Tepidisphaeraceae bacterium]
MDQQDKDRMRHFFDKSWDIRESLDAFLTRSGLTQQDLARLYTTRTFQRLRKRMCGGMATRRELEVQRAALAAAEQVRAFVAGTDDTFKELSRKVCGDLIKLARTQEARQAAAEQQAERTAEARADAGVSHNLTKAQRIAILERMLGAARQAEEP